MSGSPFGVNGFGFTYQHFAFDSLEGLSLGAIPAVFTHDDAQLGGGRSLRLSVACQQRTVGLHESLTQWSSGLTPSPGRLLPTIVSSEGAFGMTTGPRADPISPLLSFFLGREGDVTVPSGVGATAPMATRAAVHTLPCPFQEN